MAIDAGPPPNKADKQPITGGTVEVASHAHWLRPVGLFIAKLLFLLGLLGAIIAIAVGIYIAQAGGLKRLIETEFSLPDDDVETRLGAVHLRLFDRGALAALELSDVVVMGGGQALRLPQVRVDTRPAAWLEGQFWQVELSALTLDLVQQGDMFQLSGALADSFAQFKKQADSQNNNRTGTGQAKTGQAYAGQSRIPSSLALLANRQLKLSNSIVRLRNADNNAQVQLDDLTLSLIYDEQENLILSGAAFLQGHKPQSEGPNATLSFDALSNLSSGLTEVSLRTMAAPLNAFSPFVPSTVQPFTDLGDLDSTLTLVFDGAQLQTGSGSLSSSGGTLPNGAPLEVLESQFRYSRQDDYLSISHLRLSLPDGQAITFKGDVVSLSKPQIGFGGTLSLTDIPIDALLSEWPTQALPDVRAYMIASFSGGDFQRMSLDFTGQYQPQTSALSLSDLSFMGEVDNVRLETDLGDYAQIVGTANGQLALEVMSGGLLKNATASLQLKDGYITPKGAKEALRFSEMRGDIFYQPGQLALSDLTASFIDSGTLNSDITVAFTAARTLESVDFNLASDEILLDTIRALIPSVMMPTTTAYMDKTLSGGLLSQANINLSLTVDEGRFAINALTGHALLEGVDYRYLDDQEALDNLSAELAFHDNEFVIDLLTPEGGYQAPAFELASANLVIAPLISDDVRARRDIKIRLDAQADIPKILPLLDAPQIALLDKLPVNFANATGAVRARINMGGPLQQNEGLRLLPDRVDGVLTNMAAEGLYEGYDLTDAEIVFGYDGKRFDASGSASLNDIAGTFSFVQQDDVINISAQSPPQDTLAKLATDLSGQAITGAIGGRLSVETKDKGQTVTAIISADVTGASIHVPALNWTKLQRETGRAVATFEIADGMLQGVDNITIEAGDLVASGQIAMTQDGQLQSASFANMSWAGNQIDEAIILRQPDADGEDSWSVIAQGPVIDLRNLRADDQDDDQNEDQNMGEVNLVFDVTSERLMIDDKVALFGQLTGAVNTNGNGEALLQGALLYDGTPLLEEGTIEAVFGTGGEYLSAVGLIGGAEARLEFSPDEVGGSILIINTQNAGRVLSGLNITDTIRQGRMVLTNQFKSDGFENYDTTIQLEDFNVIEAPAAVRAFSVLGLAGLYALVEGDGTRFSTGEARIETRGSAHKITNLVASGGAVGLSMVGEYNSETRKVDVSGNLVPVNQFSKIIGAVPLLGDLLAGVDNAGIFATQFNVTGDIDEPVTNVNAASLVPGVLRDIFSPDWLGREADRLFGPDNKTDDEAQ